VPDWFEDERFWIDFAPIMFTEVRMAGAAEEVEGVLQLAGMTDEDGAAVLDLGCGPGRHTLALADEGFAVTGVDLSAALLERARHRAEAAGLQVELIREDMRTFVRPEAYRLAVSLLSSFGYFETRAEDLHVLQNVCRSLQPGGTFVMDLMGKEVLARQFQQAGVEAFEDGSMLFERREILDAWRRIRTEWVLVKGETARRHTIHLNLYSAQELAGALQQAGFEEVVAYGDVLGRPYGPGARRLVVVATKPGAVRP
jgi:SAM-dependent methyltransferase